MVDIMQFIVLVRRDPARPERFVAHSPDFEGWTAYAHSRAGAIDKATEIVSGLVRERQANGDALPEAHAAMAFSIALPEAGAGTVSPEAGPDPDAASIGDHAMGDGESMPVDWIPISSGAGRGGRDDHAPPPPPPQADVPSTEAPSGEDAFGTAPVEGKGPSSASARKTEDEQHVVRRGIPAGGRHTRDK